MSNTSPASDTTQLSENDVEKLLRANRVMNQLLGEAVSLMLPIPRYQDWRIADIKARLLPPLALQQFRIFRQKGFPVAFVTWAMLNEDIERRLTESPAFPLTPREWHSGSRLHFVDVVSPKGNAEEIKAAVRNDLAKKRANGADPAPAGKGGIPA